MYVLFIYIYRFTYANANINLSLTLSIYFTYFLYDVYTTHAYFTSWILQKSVDSGPLGEVSANLIELGIQR